MAASPALSRRTRRGYAHVRLPFSALLVLAFLALLTPLASPAAAAPDTTPGSITLTFLDQDGLPLGDPQTIPRSTCISLDFNQGLDPTDPDFVDYSSVVASEPQAALNIYSSQFCQTLASSAVGQWDNADPLTDMISIRYEGLAPASMVPGTLSPSAFPPGLVVPTQAPSDPTSSPSADPNAGPVADPAAWKMDASKGKIVVGLVSAVLVIGVLLGVYQVYEAAQYVPPPKKPKKPTMTKKIKKKDAYFKKPVRDDPTFQRLLNNDSPEPYASSQRPLMSERGGRDSRLSEAATFVDWSQQQQQQQKNRQSDAVLIDMQETTDTSMHPGSNQTRLGGPLPAPPNTGSSILIQFDNYDGTGTGPSSYSNSSSNSTGSTYASQSRVAAGEVLVPMNTFEYNYLHPSQRQYPQPPQQQQYGHNGGNPR
ncbi:hypothetical protein BGZ98_003045 [Dissophora globulifera]|nr:hypothetical protein BGZ98_003045 [Dissophora globulifera]